MAFEVEGIILRSFDYGEKHKIVKMMTPKLGVISIFVSNAKKTNTNRSALVQPLTCARFNVKESANPSDDLFFMYNGEVEEYFMEIKLDYEKVTYFYYMAEIILKGIFGNETSQYIYTVLKKSLLLAEEGRDAYLLSIIFQFKMLPALGIKPMLDGCAICNSKERIVTLSVSQGGLVCSNCFNSVESVLIDAPLIPIVRALYKVDLDQFPEIELEPSLLEPVEQFLEIYYDTYSGLNLKTKKFMKEIKQI